MTNSIKCFWVFAIIGTTAMAAPLKTTTSLPLTGNDIRSAMTTLKTQKSAEQFTTFIKSLDVFADHQNPTTIAQMENRSIKKAFYVAPFFQASHERASVGGQEIAERAIKILTEAYELMMSFDFELMKINQLKLEVNKKTNALEKLRRNLPELTNALAIQSTMQLIANIEREIVTLNKQVETLEQQARQSIANTSTVLRQQVASQIQLRLAFLGVTATPEESALLQSAHAADLQRGLANIIARASNDGQFGFRTAIYEAGYTEQQRDWIALYRSVRPDVTVSSLATNTVYARSTALTAKNAVTSDHNYFLGKDNIVSGSRMILGVNAGSQGACGNTRSCNVTMEYTWLGASMAQAAVSGSIAMPVYFEADVSFVQPDFEGSVTCDFTNGFSVKGRADVKDGAIIYDGDVSNKINYAAIENGSCNYQIVKGDAQSAAYYTIKSLHDNYMNLKMQRAEKSRAEKDRYKEYVNKELAYHASRSQNTNFDFWSLSTWTTALGAPWGTVASFVVGAARSFYWHTRVEDSSTTEAVKFTTTIKESNVQKTERVAFNGFTLLCWKKDNAGLSLAACPSAAQTEYQNQADTDLGKHQQLCDIGINAECIERAAQYARNPIIDERGVVVDPWA